MFAMDIFITSKDHIIFWNKMVLRFKVKENQKKGN